MILDGPFSHPDGHTQDFLRFVRYMYTPIKALKRLAAKLVFRQIAALTTCLSHVTLSTNSLPFIEPQLGFHIIKVTHGNGVSCFDFCVHIIYSALFLQNVCVCVCVFCKYTYLCSHLYDYLTPYILSPPAYVSFSPSCINFHHPSRHFSVLNRDYKSI